MLGLFGVDLIRAGDELFVIEVNPRYTSSIEVLELAGAGMCTLPYHARAFGAKPEFLQCPERLENSPSIGKAIYYAPRELRFSQEGPWENCTRPDPWLAPKFADIPRPGTSLARGQPVMTLLAGGTDDASMYQELRRRAAELDRFFAL